MVPMFKCGFVRSNFSFAMVVTFGLADLAELGSGGGTRTRDPTIMSRVLLPTELLRQVERTLRARPGEPPYGLEP